jgi:UDP:flavonoid glycosyltransferase YjiC (YdhE family)
MQVWGSDGDIRPMIALGAGLRRAGHQVTITIASIDNKSYAGLCAKTGITMIKIPVEFNADITGITLKNGRPANSAEIMNNIFEINLYPYLNDLYSASQHLCERNDLVIGHFSCFYLKAAAALKNIPYIGISYWPGLVPSESEAPFLFPWLGKSFPLLSWSLFMTQMDMALKKKINGFFVEKGFPPIKHVLTGAWMSDDLNLIACSKIFFSEPKDWSTSGRVHITGFFNIPEAVEHTDFTPELKEFLTRRGDHPVFMTLGSSLHVDPKRGMELMIEAARLYKKKVIIQTGLEKYPPNTFLQNIYFSARMPHREILPFCLAALHHCGAGTTQSVTRAGLPSIPLYFMDEQMMWGTRLFKMGIASKPVSFLKATPQSIFESIKNVVTNSKMKDKAEETAKHMHMEDGVKEAVLIIDKFIASVVNPQ